MFVSMKDEVVDSEVFGIQHVVLAQSSLFMSYSVGYKVGQAQWWLVVGFGISCALTVSQWERISPH